jgi:hypothetical protein
MFDTQKSIDYWVRFRGHIIEIKRPDGFPQMVSYDKIFRVQNREQLNQNIMTDAAFIILKQRGMIVLKNQDPAAMQIGDDAEFENRMFVPMEMIAYFDCEVKLITGETPNHEDGETFLGSGIDKKELKGN